MKKERKHKNNIEILDNKIKNEKRIKVSQWFFFDEKKEEDNKILRVIFHYNLYLWKIIQ